jgi:thioredoxin-like negative regulator of GroEL
MSKKEVVSKIDSKDHFFNMLQTNPGLIIIKLGASWCKPCKQIKEPVEKFFLQTPNNIVCCDIDVDDCDEIYTFLKNKRMIKSIPTILCYKKGNVEYAPDDSFTGSDLTGVERFFNRCVIYSKDVQK